MLDDAEVGPAPALFTLDEPGLAKDLEVVADGWLAEAEWFREVADTGLVVRLGVEQAEYP